MVRVANTLGFFYHKNTVVLIVAITVLTYGFIKIFYRETW